MEKDKILIRETLKRFSPCVVIPIILEFLGEVVEATPTKIDDYIFGVINNIFHIAFPSCFRNEKSK